MAYYLYKFALTFMRVNEALVMVLSHLSSDTLRFTFKTTQKQTESGTEKAKKRRGQHIEEYAIGRLSPPRLSTIPSGGVQQYSTVECKKLHTTSEGGRAKGRYAPNTNAVRAKSLLI